MSVLKQEIDHYVLPVVALPIADCYARLRMGAGGCTICDCPSWIPSQGRSTCINRNSEGGTCNHTFDEHGD